MLEIALKQINNLILHQIIACLGASDERLTEPNITNWVKHT